MGSTPENISESDERLLDMFGISSRMREVFRQLQLLAPLDATVCLEGEPGAGKRTAAQTLHQLSPRAGGPCLTLEATSLSPSLFEGQLFGHDDPAVASVLGSRQGLAAQADGGSLIVHEVTDLTRSNQSLLLRFLEDRTVRPAHQQSGWTVQVRVICTSSRNLSREVEAGRLDPNLFLALRVFTVCLPALRERPEDLPMLIQHLLERSMRAHAKQVRGLSPEAAELLAAYAWPGNVQELTEEIERVVILTPASSWAKPEVLSSRVREPERGPDGNATRSHGSRDAESG